jgi:hypothetical protein
VQTTAHAKTPIPAAAGIGLRGGHYRDLDWRRPASIGWLEVHPENYFGRGGLPHYYLERLRADYALSLHGVGMSLGSTDPLDDDHLGRLRELVDRYQPGLVSEHLSWGSQGGIHFNDLLPIPLNESSLAHMAARVHQVQDMLGRRILIENASTYLTFVDSDVPEPEFLAALADRTGCGLLLDVNNVYVNAMNHGFDADRFVDAIPAVHVAEVHVAGHTVKALDVGEIRIDTHNARTCEEVWRLLHRLIDRIGPRPVLVEWDTDLPTLDVLLDEADRAGRILDERRARAA